MDTWEDIARDEWISDLYSDFARDVLEGRDDLYGQVIDHFAAERLQSFYVENPTVAKPALLALTEARALVKAHPSAAVVLAVTATEVGLKSTLLKPILHGLVHLDTVAAMIAELVPDQRNDKFKDVLFTILRECGGVDLRSHTRPGGTRKLWDEIAEIQRVRNRVVHRADQASPEEARTAVDIATVVVEQLFPTVVNNLGLHVHAGLAVCGKQH
jgi:hypothetical protein